MPIPKIVVTAALTVAQMALTATRKIEGPRLEDLDVTLADYGTPLNYFYGTRRFNVPIIWAEEIRETKKKRKTKGGKFNEYRYFGTWAVAIADHEIDAVTRIWFDKHLVYDATGTGPISALDEGELNAHMRIYLGTETQEPDPRMQATVEAEQGAGTCPAYRGVAYIVFEELKLEPFGNRIPQISVEAVTNASGSLPFEEIDTDQSNGYFFMVGGPWMLYYDGNGDIEWWDLPTRTLLGTSNGGGVAFTPIVQIGLANDGTAYYMGYRIVGVDLIPNFYTVTPIGVAVRSDDLDPDKGYGEVTRAYDTDGGRVVLSNREGQGYFSFGVYNEHELAARDFFIDTDGEVWGIFQPEGSSDTFALQNMTGGGLYEFTGTSRAAVSKAYGCATASNTYFIVTDGNWYAIDRDTMTITDTGSVLWNSEVVTEAGSWPHNRPGVASFWDNNEEYSLADGSLIRTVTGWAHGEAAHRYTHDPVNHAIIIRPQFQSYLIWQYLDRVSGAGVTLGSIVADVSTRCDIASGDRETSNLDQTVRGWSWTQGSGKAIIEPLVDFFDSICRPHDFKVQFLKRTGTSTGTAIDVGEFVGDDPRYTITITQDTDLPRGVSMSFADHDHEQQPNTAVVQRPLDHVDAERQASIDLTTLVLTATEAKQGAERWFRRAWNAREEYRHGLTAQRTALEPGDVKMLGLDAITRTGELQKLTFRADDSLACEWRQDFPSLALLSSSEGAAQDGRRDPVILIPHVSRAFALDIPLVRDTDNNSNPLIYMGAAPYGAGFWPGAILYQLEGGDYDLEVGGVDSSSDATWGLSTGTLANATHYVWDRGNSVNVELRNGSISSATEADCNANPRLNLALLGDELIQFTTATLQGDGSYTLTGLKRGRRGTEWATGTHAAGDLFVMMDHIAPVEMSSGDIGADLSFKAVTNGLDAGTAAAEDVDDYEAASHRPWAPDQLKATLSGGDWTLTWKRRSRVAGDYSPGIPPLGESAESYDALIYRSGFGSAATRTITVSSETATYTAAQQVTDGGAVAVGDLDWGVLQVGDLADGYEKQASH